MGVSNAARLAAAVRSASVGGVVGKVERNAGQVADPARGVDVGLHRHQHALHVRTLDDRGHAFALFGAAALPALAGISQRLLIGAVADGHPLRADSEPRGVHHHEHGGEAAVLLTHQPGLRALVVAIDHDASRGAVDAELVLDSRAAQVVALAERSIGVDEEFRRKKQRKAARPRRRARQSGENEMDDILGEIMLAIGDEDLLAEQPIRSVLGAFRPGSHGAQIRACLRLGQIHGAAPPPADHWREIDVGEFARAMRLQGADGALGQERAEREGHRGAVPDFGAGDVDEMRQAHAAELGRRRDAVPAGLRPAPIDVGEAGGRCHNPVFIFRAGKIAGAVERRDFRRGEAAGFSDNGGYSVPIEFAQEPPFNESGEIGDRVQRKKDVGRRRTIRHLSAPPYRQRAGRSGCGPTGPGVDHVGCRGGDKRAYVQSGSRAMRTVRRDGAQPQNYPPCRAKPSGDRRRGRVPSRGRPRRHAD